MSSLSISGNDPTARLAQTSDEPKKTDENTKKGHQEFDFSGAAYSAVHVPTGLISAPPSKAQLQADLKDTVESAKKVLADLKSPELQKLAWEGGKVGFESAKFAKELVELTKHGAEACEGSPVGIAETVKDLFGVTQTSFELAHAIKDLQEANTPEARAKLNELTQHLHELNTSRAKLQMDLTQFAGAAPIRFATTGRI